MLAAARWIQRFLFAIGCVILGYCGAAWVGSRWSQFQGARELDRLQTEQPASPGGGVPLPEGSLIGKVEISKLHLSAVVFQGTEDATLDRGVGHVNESALPGQRGNVVLAAHRDSFFRGLRTIAKGDIVKVTTPAGARSYLVESTQVVTPDQTSVMDPTPNPTLTLITCYPFYYVGHAPKRFVVRAREVDSPEPSGEPELSARASQTARRLSSRPADTEEPTYLFKASQ